MSAGVGMMHVRGMQPTAPAVGIDVQVQADGLRGQQAGEHERQDARGQKVHIATIHECRPRRSTDSRAAIFVPIPSNARCGCCRHPAASCRVLRRVVNRR